MQREIVKLNGKPQTVVLQFATGKSGDNGRGEYFLYTLEGDRVLFAQPDLNDEIQNLRPRKGDRLVIQKLSAGGWSVLRAGGGQDLEDPTRNTINTPANHNTRTETLTRLGEVLTAAPTPAPAPTPKPAPAALMTGQSQFLLQQLTAAVEVVHAVENYAKLLGRPITFSSEDVRAIAISCFISQDRGGRA